MAKIRLKNQIPDAPQSSILQTMGSQLKQIEAQNKLASAETAKTLAEANKIAGITKHITFHCFRHTFATLQIALGTDIYTVSKMLTHKNVTTTQIYADLVSSKKRESANKISLK